MEGSDTDFEYESDAPGPPTKKKLRTEIVHKKCVTTYSRQDFKPSETQSTDIESRKGLQIIGDIVIEHYNNQMEVDDSNPTIPDHVQKPRQIIGVRLNKAPKTSAERGREFRARKALLKQQSKQQQEPDAIVEIATEDIRSAGPSEDNQVHGPSEKTTIEKKAKSAEATRRWREKKKGVSESSKKQAKTAAQRMREYRERKKFDTASESKTLINEEKAKNSAKMNDDELILRRKKQNADRARAYRKRKKDLDAMPSTSTVQSGEPGSENIVTAKLLHQKQLNAERCRRYRQKSKRLKSGANFNRGTSDSNTSTSRDTSTSRELIVNPEVNTKSFIKNRIESLARQCLVNSTDSSSETYASNFVVASSELPSWHIPVTATDSSSETYASNIVVASSELPPWRSPVMASDSSSETYASSIVVASSTDGAGMSKARRSSSQWPGWADAGAGAGAVSEAVAGAVAAAAAAEEARDVGRLVDCSQADDRRMIRLVRARPLLYARNNMPVASYYSRVKALWGEVAHEMDWTVADVRRKWSHIRNSYSRHLRNELHGARTGRGRAVSRWYLADELDFLRDHMATDTRPPSLSSYVATLLEGEPQTDVKLPLPSWLPPESEDSCSFGPDENTSFFHFFRGLHEDYQQLPPRKQRLFKRRCLDFLHELLDEEEPASLYQADAMNLSRCQSEDEVDSKICVVEHAVGDV